tara:strand:- start:163 stop:456 length:294 start_codon:yes stop_codon:yes gene_type:complete
MSLTIPDVRDRLNALVIEQRALADRQQEIAREIEGLIQHMYRRTYNRAPVTSRRITAEIHASVRDTAVRHPDMPHQEIAEMHNINIGRVSEILHGRR